VGSGPGRAAGGGRVPGDAGPGAGRAGRDSCACRRAAPLRPPGAARSRCCRPTRGPRAAAPCGRPHAPARMPARHAAAPMRPRAGARTSERVLDAVDLHAGVEHAHAAPVGPVVCRRQIVHVDHHWGPHGARGAAPAPAARARRRRRGAATAGRAPLARLLADGGGARASGAEEGGVREPNGALGGSHCVAGKVGGCVPKARRWLPMRGAAGAARRRHRQGPRPPPRCLPRPLAATERTDATNATLRTVQERLRARLASLLLQPGLGRPATPLLFPNATDLLKRLSLCGRFAPATSDGGACCSLRQGGPSSPLRPTKNILKVL
jgi:hypothetical protein